MAKVTCSDFLCDKMDAMAELIELLDRFFDYASILGCDTYGKSYMVHSNVANIQDHPGNECGFVVRVLKRGRFFEYSFNTWDEPEVLFEIIKKQYHEDWQIQNESAFENYDELTCQDAMIYESDEKTVRKTVAEMGTAQLMQELTRAKDRLMSYDPRIQSASVNFNQVHVSKVFISQNKELSMGYMYSELILVVTVQDHGKIYTENKILSGLAGVELLEKIEPAINEVCREALAMLESVPMVPGEYDVICTPEISGLIAHEAFGHGVEMDMFVKNRALAKDYIGKMVASPLVTMIDGARPKEEVASYLFDDEGNLGKETRLIENGILRRGISDEASAIRCHTQPSGNGRRESFERKAYSRMTNTYFEKGDAKLEDMIASIQYGFLLEGVDSGMEDPKHWGIQCIISKAKEIVDGKLSGKIFAPVILTGYVPDLLKSISMVGDRVELFGGGSCGKGHKEWVKVSDGGPYMKAKARLG